MHWKNTEARWGKLSMVLHRWSDRSAGTTGHAGQALLQQYDAARKKA